MEYRWILLLKVLIFQRFTCPVGGGLVEAYLEPSQTSKMEILVKYLTAWVSEFTLGFIVKTVQSF